MGAVRKPDVEIRPITDCSMPRDISVNNYCSDIIEGFQYKSVDNVLSMHSIIHSSSRHLVCL